MTEALLSAYQHRLDEILRKSVAASLDAIENGLPKRKALDSSPIVEKAMLEAFSAEIQTTVAPLVDKLMRILEERDKRHAAEIARLTQKLAQLETRLAMPVSNDKDSIQSCISQGRWMDALRIATNSSASFDPIVCQIENAEEFLASHPMDDGFAVDVCVSLCRDLLADPTSVFAAIKVELVNELVLNLSGFAAQTEFNLLTQLLSQLGAQSNLSPAMQTRLAEVYTMVVATHRVTSTFATPTPRYSM